MTTEHDFARWQVWLALERAYDATYDAKSYVEAHLPPDSVHWLDWGEKRFACTFAELHEKTRPAGPIISRHQIAAADELEASLRPQLAEARRARAAAMRAGDLPAKMRLLRQLERQVRKAAEAITAAASVSPVAMAARLHIILIEELREHGALNSSSSAKSILGVLRALVPVLPAEMAATIRGIVQVEHDHVDIRPLLGLSPDIATPAVSAAAA